VKEDVGLIGRRGSLTAPHSWVVKMGGEVMDQKTQLKIKRKRRTSTGGRKQMSCDCHLPEIVDRTFQYWARKSRLQMTRRLENNEEKGEITAGRQITTFV